MEGLTEDSTALVRTDFSMEPAWRALKAAVATPSSDGFLASVDIVDDRRFAGMAPGEVLGSLPDGYGHPIVVVADTVTLAEAELPLLVIDLDEEPGRSIRLIPDELWCIENNLWVGNMYFEDFIESADSDGVFRG